MMTANKIWFINQLGSNKKIKNTNVYIPDSGEWHLGKVGDVVAIKDLRWAALAARRGMLKSRYEKNNIRIIPMYNIYYNIDNKHIILQTTWTDKEGADFPIAEFLIRTRFDSSPLTENVKQLKTTKIACIPYKTILSLIHQAELELLCSLFCAASDAFAHLPRHCKQILHFLPDQIPELWQNCHVSEGGVYLACFCFDPCFFYYPFPPKLKLSKIMYFP